MKEGEHMNISVSENLDNKQEVLALGLFDDDIDYYSSYNKALSDELKDAISKKSFELEFGRTYTTKIDSTGYKRIIVVALGKKQDLTIDRVRRAMNRIVAFMKSLKLYSFTTDIVALCASQSLKNSDVARAAAEGLILSEYSFEKYKIKKSVDKGFNAVLQGVHDLSPYIIQGTIIANATNYAKDLINEPAIVATPEFIESQARKIKSPKIKVKVMDKKELVQKGLNAILAVSAGSDKSPKLIFIEYNGAGKAPYTAIIGKGITFDSGGYNLKPTGAIEDMKCDMAGAAAILGTIIASSKLGIKKNILGVIPACENMINGSAIKPGDIVRAYNGKTIEILNTDAEGRLILADAISYAEKNYSPEKIIDLATLTGACIVALGHHASGIFSNDEGLSKELIDAGEQSHDRLWPLPLFEEYMDDMEGDITDLKNSAKIADRTAGAIRGAVFISKFVEKSAWAHIDIAGPAYLSEPHEYNQKYATGCGVRLLTYYFMK
jgi:leucyl aminopeptidase